MQPAPPSSDPRLILVAGFGGTSVKVGLVDRAGRVVRAIGFGFPALIIPANRRWLDAPLPPPVSSGREAVPSALGDDAGLLGASQLDSRS